MTVAQNNLGDVRNAVGIWNQIRAQYPQLTRNAYINFLSDNAIHRSMGPKYDAMSYGGADPNGTDPQGRGQIVMNTKYLNSDPATIRFLMLKELGQADSKQMLGTPERADAYLRALGYNSQPDAARYPSGLPGASWNGDTSHVDRLPDSINVGGYTSFPEDTYGIAFANALGSPYPFPNKGGPSFQGGALAAMQSQGMLPRQVGGPAPAPTPAMLPSQVHNPMMASYMARLANVQAAHPPLPPQPVSQNDRAAVAMRGGMRNF